MDSGWVGVGCTSENCGGLSQCRRSRAGSRSCLRPNNMTDTCDTSKQNFRLVNEGTAREDEGVGLGREGSHASVTLRSSISDPLCPTPRVLVVAGSISLKASEATVHEQGWLRE